MNLKKRVAGALHRIKNGQAVTRIPPHETDVDVVINDLWDYAKNLEAANTDLLAVLEAMVAEYGEFYGDTPDVAAQYQSPLIKKAMQAIAKAKGEKV